MSAELSAFLERHPWPSAMLEGRRPLDVLWRFELPASASALWPYLVETSRLNRAIGVSPMEFGERTGVLHGSTENLFMRQEWVEVPWDWAWARSLSNVREYSRGFAHRVRAFYELERLGEDRTLLSVYFGWVPRGPISRAILAFGMSWLERGYRRTLDELVPKVGSAPAHIALAAPAPDLAPEQRERLRGLEARLGALDLDAKVVERLVSFVERGDEMELFRIQVPRLAADLDLDEDALLEACLHATRIGLLELSWDVICPHCRGVRRGVRHLGELPPRDRCEVCAIEFGTGDPSSIEVTFRVHSSVREVPQRFYCSAEPATKPHIKLQQRIAPGEVRRVSLELAPGDYRARLRAAEPSGSLVIAEQGALELRWSASDAAPALAGGADPTIVLENPTDEEVTFVIEVPAWSHRALRPVRLFNLQRFRDLFSEEYLGAEVQLAVGEQTILFTDLVGSTRFYRHRGDPDAFVLVKRHFAEVFEVVAAHRGAVVKTIGDAVMAAFVDGADAVRAAAAIQERFGPEQTLRLRISMHAGPCIAVNLNSGIDYFGSTVNMAAKLQACAEAGEIALSKVVHDAPGVAAALDALGAALEPMELEHAALDAPMPLYRWTPDPAQSGSAQQRKPVE